MTQRTYVPTLLTLTHIVCGVITRARPVMQKRFPGNTALFSALDTLEDACQAITIILETLRDYE